MQVYKDMVKYVLENGVRKKTRTGTDTLSVFGYFYKVDISERYPLLTTKYVSFDNVWRELLWYLSGAQDINELKKHTKIWDAWADEDGKLETAYGRYWRRFPIQLNPSCDVTGYDGTGIKDTLLSGEVTVGPNHPCVKITPSTHDDIFASVDTQLEVDQIAYVIQTLKEMKTNPETINGRRLIISAWHPGNAIVSKLPPCHYTFAFNVLGNKLNCHLTQRSGDIGLGIPYNLACYSLLTKIIAKLTGYEPGEFAHTIIDAHIYVNHIEELKEQLKREPKELPYILVNDNLTDIDDITYDDVVLYGYNHHPKIKMDVSV